MQTKIDTHKLIMFSLISLISLTLFINAFNIINKIEEENLLSINIANISSEIINIENIGKEKDSWRKLDINYYFNNIIAYSIVEKIKNIKVNPVETKFNKTTCLEITFEKLEKDKLIKMIKDLSLLGFVSSAENGKIILNVSPFSMEEAKEELNKKI